ncbi:MAG: serine/threonine protein kinase [Lachnospiraceae bacterium]|nr:serine/threonine protein kinase [Lachnospiraceae bacterium]
MPHVTIIFDGCILLPDPDTKEKTEDTDFMEEQNTDALSHYQPATIINARHGIQLVQHEGTGRLFVKKQLKQYNLEVFQMLRAHPVPNTPRIYELVEENGTLTVIEEYLQGQTLQGLLEEHGNFSENEAIAITLAIAGIVQNLHHMEPPIIHRDIKPANLILSPDHVLKLLDFNAAKFASDGENRDTVLLGTAGYAAPEQYGFGASCLQTDIFSIGVILNVLLTGSLPQEKLTEGRLSAMIKKCVEVNPRDRYASIDQFIGELLWVRDNPNALPPLAAAFYAQDRAWNPAAKAAPGSRRRVGSDKPSPTRSDQVSSSTESSYSEGIYDRPNDDAGADGHDKMKGGPSAEAAAGAEREDPASASMRRFLPPGFRSGSPTKIVIAIAGYLILLFNGIKVAFPYLAVIFFSANYLDVQSALPLTDSKRWPVRIIGVVLYDVIIFVVVFVIEMILFGW